MITMILYEHIIINSYAIIDELWSILSKTWVWIPALEVLKLWTKGTKKFDLSSKLECFAQYILWKSRYWR